MSRKIAESLSFTSIGLVHSNRLPVMLLQKPLMRLFFLFFFPTDRYKALNQSKRLAKPVALESGHNERRPHTRGLLHKTSEISSPSNLGAIEVLETRNSSPGDSAAVHYGRERGGSGRPALKHLGRHGNDAPAPGAAARPRWLVAKGGGRAVNGNIRPSCTT